MSFPEKTPLTIADVIPHTGKMRLLDELLAHGDSFAESRVRINTLTLFHRHGEGVPVWFGLEYMAQTMAAWNGIRGRGKGEAVRLALLVGIRAMECSVPFFLVGQTLRIRVDFAGDFSGLASFDGRITDEATGNVLVMGAINAYQPENFDKYLEAEARP